MTGVNNRFNSGSNDKQCHMCSPESLSALGLFGGLLRAHWIYYSGPMPSVSNEDVRMFLGVCFVYENEHEKVTVRKSRSRELSNSPEKTGDSILSPLARPIGPVFSRPSSQVDRPIV